MTQSLLFVQPQAVVTRQRSMPASSIFRKARNGEMTLSSHLPAATLSSPTKQE